MFQVSPLIDDAEVELVSDVVRSGWLSEGPKSGEFTERFLESIGAQFGVLAPNGTLALSLAAMAAGIEPGDEVLVPDVTFYGSATALMMLDINPVPVDVDPLHFQIDLSLAEQALTSRTKAIMPVHLYGTACDMRAVEAFAMKHRLVVIEDAAQAVGVCSGSAHAGTIGDFGAFSFFADKTMTMGEGGFVTCRDESAYERLRYLRNQGRLDRGSFVHQSVGVNFRITDMQAAIGLSQLARLPEIIATKQRLWASYSERLAHLDDVRLLDAAETATHVPFRAVVITERADLVRSHLEDVGVQTRTGFYPVHRQPGLSKWRSKRGLENLEESESFKVSDAHFRNAILLPLHCGMGEDDVDVVVAGIRAGLAR